MKETMMRFLQFTMGVLFVLLAGQAFAAAPTDFTGLVSQVQQGLLKPLMQVVVALSYVSGVGFCVGGIFKLKAHKDNPQQVTIGTALFLLGVGIALLFVPTLIDLAGKSIGLTSGGAYDWTGDTVTG
jgi:intracellular multiplication protein IcmD